jgi:formamidopyrimidine-DNA glycosylase
LRSQSDFTGSQQKFVNQELANRPRKRQADDKLLPMPELPDITAYITALETRILSQRLEHVRIASAFLLRTAQPPVSATEGKTVRELRRVGKRIAIGVEGDLWLVLHLMIAGRLHWRPPAAKLAGRNSLAAFDFPNGSLTLTEAGSKRRASLHIVAGEAALEAMNPGGIEVCSSDRDEFRKALSVENRTLKRAMTDPRIVSGIGNAYSDEILHAAQLSPILQTHKLTSGQWEKLFSATKQTLQLWIDRMNAEAETAFPEKVTAFRPEMAVHGRFGQPCPRCGEKIQRIRYADNETDYCARCQTGGRVLADRSLSRLMKSDWPRTLDELEALKRR